MSKTSDKLPISTEEGRKRGEMLEALRKHKGIVWKACQDVGITRHQHNDWLRDDVDYKQVYYGIMDDRTDYVESKLLELVDGAYYEVVTQDGIQVVKDSPNAQAVKFYLSTKAKDRGYVERQEITGADGGPVQIIAPDNI
jgi:hypothetical protein